MGQISFGPGEEKLAEMMELIVGLQQAVVQLAQRSEVDGILISLFLDELEDPAATLANWQSKMAGFYADRATQHLGREGMEGASEELKSRMSLWTRALEARVRAHDSD